MKSAGSTLTAQELEIMKVIWRLGPCNVRQVYEDLLKRRQIAYTTVMTMMNILEQKEFLKKSTGDKAFVYSPSKPERQVLRAMVAEFVDRVFNGAAEPLLLHLVEDERLTRQELDEIRSTIDAHASSKPTSDAHASSKPTNDAHASSKPSNDAHASSKPTKGAPESGKTTNKPQAPGKKIRRATRGERS